MNNGLSDARTKRAFLNIFISLLCQFLILICGLIVPQLFIKNYGSEAYGATASIAQFLAYISLLEGGIGGVARASLYKPLAEGDKKTISKIILEIRKFFNIIAYIFIVYTLFLACSFKTISHIECYDWISSFLLVIAISISTVAQYFFGISYATLIQAAQRTYITDMINISTTILNTIAVILLVKFGSSLIVVKFISSFIYVLRPLLMYLYVKKEFSLPKVEDDGEKYLTQKWDGLGQHIAFFLYSNTDIAVLTILANLKTVSVYSVYYMVLVQIDNIVASFSSGMEALFGDMLAKKEMDKLNNTFGYYETLISIIALILFSVTACLIVPFIKLYTKNATDANYIQPVFASLLIIAYLITAVRRPYHNMVIAAGHFKQTQVAAYGEAFINVAISIILVRKFGLIGVAIGTLVATLFRLLYYVGYLSKNICFRKTGIFIKRAAINIFIFILIYFIGFFICKKWIFSNYFMWLIAGVVLTVCAFVVTLSIYTFVYKNDIYFLLSKVLKKQSNNSNSCTSNT